MVAVLDASRARDTHAARRRPALRGCSDRVGRPDSAATDAFGARVPVFGKDNRSLSTTMRYMHVCAGAPEAAIRSLDGPESMQVRGEMLEKAPGESGRAT